MITGIGAAVFDRLITMERYPREDSKQEGTEVRLAGGGPCATGLAAAAKLGGRTAYIGCLAGDAEGKFLLEDFRRYGVGTELVSIAEKSISFSSSIWLSREQATRTCVFHRGNVPPLRLNDRQKAAVASSSVLLLDGNEREAALEAAALARSHSCKVLLDAGGLYPGIGDVLAAADVLIPSEEFALQWTGEKTAEAAALVLHRSFHPEAVVITRGKQGGLLYDGTVLWEYPAFPVEAVDTNGAGDVFHGVYAYGLAEGMGHKRCCIMASAASAMKCRVMGAREGAPDYAGLMEFLKERGVSGEL
ncbi:MAG: carbohydrate kinase, PfkB family [Paenibacillaceae bacterium]|nr:carbohydrate kinase, PfkB family [Paenibacillaceae bacterium]